MIQLVSRFRQFEFSIFPISPDFNFMSNSSDNPLPSPQELTNFFNNACVLHEQGDLNEAIEAYKYLLTLGPDSPVLHFNCGLAYFDSQQFATAEKHYRRASEINPDDPDIHFNQGLNFRRLGKVKEAAESFTQALKLGDSSIDTLYNLALCHQDLNETGEATRLYSRILARAPEHQPTLNNYAYLCHKSGDSEKAGTLYRRLLEHNPDHQAARHMLNALAGEKPDTAPLEYVEGVFDNYAKDFEHSLVQQLHYKTPQILWDRYRRLFGETPRENCLDLGCGTGLAGVQFAPCCANMVGVDISEEMLCIAKEKNLYNELIKDNIVHFLDTTPHCYDLIVAADVFTYIGNLSEIFTACFKKTAEEGIFLFSVEESAGNQFELKETGRFGHAVHYIQNVCQSAGWSILDNHLSKLRLDKGQWIKGSLFILQK
jgi:predicted TPR repeat methyltransferase